MAQHGMARCTMWAQACGHELQPCFIFCGLAAPAWRGTAGALCCNLLRTCFYAMCHMRADRLALPVHAMARHCGAKTVRLPCIITHRSILTLPFPAGDNRIILHGGANTAPWALGDEARAAISSAGAVLLQREIPEAVNTEVAQVIDGFCMSW